MSNEAPTRWTTRAALTTGAVWVVGIALQLAASPLRDHLSTSLSDDLFVTSMIAPAWTFLQVCLLAGALRLARSRTDAWSPRARTGIAIAAAVVFMLLQPGFVSLVLSGAAAFDPADHVSVALLWSTPLALYVAPASIVAWAWLRRDPRVTLPRALGIALVVQALMNFGFIIWLTHLWAAFVNVPPSAPGL